MLSTELEITFSPTSNWSSSWVTRSRICLSSLLTVVSCGLFPEAEWLIEPLTETYKQVLDSSIYSTYCIYIKVKATFTLVFSRSIFEAEWFEHIITFLNRFVIKTLNLKSKGIYIWSENAQLCLILPLNIWI